MKTKFLVGDVNWKKYGGKFVTKRLNNGDWNYYLVISVINMHEATGDENTEKYSVEIQAVSPVAASSKLDTAIGSLGMSDEDLTRHENDPLFQVEALSEYGIYAPLRVYNGDNIDSLMKDARKELDLIEMLFGMYMDAPKNGIGQTGWNLISGQDVREFFKS